MFFSIRRYIGLVACLAVLTTLAVSERPALAGLVFRDVNVTLDASQVSSYDLDVDLDGTIDFAFTSAFLPDPVLPLGFNVIDFPFASNNSVVIDAQATDGFPTVSRLSLGNIVSNTSLFSSPTLDQGNLSFFTGTDPSTGNFEGQSGYVGLKFDRLAGTTFGFAEISINALNDAVSPLSLTIRSVAYNDIAGEAATISAVPEPSSMVLAAVSLGWADYINFGKSGGSATKSPSETAITLVPRLCMGTHRLGGSASCVLVHLTGSRQSLQFSGFPVRAWEPVKKMGTSEVNSKISAGFAHPLDRQDSYEVYARS